MHQGVIELCERYGLKLSSDDSDATLSFHLYRKERHRIVVRFTPVEGDPNSVTMFCSVKVRRPVIGQVRVDKYLDLLAKEVNEHTDSRIVLAIPCGVGIRGVVGLNSFVDEYPDMSWVNAANFLMWRYIMLIRTASIMIDLNHRLYDRRGTDDYKKLLPSRLVALTLCGLIGRASVN